MSRRARPSGHVQRYGDVQTPERLDKLKLLTTRHESRHSRLCKGELLAPKLHSKLHDLMNEWKGLTEVERWNRRTLQSVTAFCHCILGEAVMTETQIQISKTSRVIIVLHTTMKIMLWRQRRRSYSKEGTEILIIIGSAVI